MKTNRLFLILCLLFVQRILHAQKFDPTLLFKSAWNVASPVEGAVYQRDLDSKAVIKIKGSYQKNGIAMNQVTISAELKKLDIYGNDTGTPALTIPISSSYYLFSTSHARNFSGELSVPAGWYLLTIKGTAPFRTPDVKTMKIGVGEVFVIAGQSNAQGLQNTIGNNNVVNLPLVDAVRIQPDRFEEAQYLSATDPGSLAVATNFKVKKPVFSPLISGKEAYNDVNSGIAPLGNSLWYWVAFGETIAKRYQIPVALFNAAWGGTTIRNWQESTNASFRSLGSPEAIRSAKLNPNMDSLYQAGAPYGILKNALKFYASTFGVRSVLWLQGETDAKALRDPAWQRQRVSGNDANAQKQDYANKLTAVINKSRQDLQPRSGDDPLAWVVGQTSTFEGVSVYFPKSGQTQAETQSAQTVRAGQAAVITSGLAFQGADIDGVQERATGGGEPTHLAGVGLQKASEAWYYAISNSFLFTKDPIRPARLGTEPQDLQLDENGTITTPLPAGAQYVWYSGNGGRIDLNAPAGFGTSMPSGITNPAVFVQYSDGSSALGGLVLPNVDGSTNPPSSGQLAFQIVSYDCNTGVLQYQFTSSDNSPVSVTIPGIFAGTMNPNAVVSYTFPSDAKTGRTVTGSASQGSSQTSVNFTTSCDLSGTNPNPNPPTGGSNNGTGLLGSYYNNVDLSGNPVRQQVDPTVNFTWGSDGQSPAAGVNATNMSVRWSGQVEAPVSGTFKFKTLNDDATRLTVNGQQLITDWPGGHGPIWKEGSINLTAGQKYDIILDFNQGWGGAQAQLYWEYPGQGSQIIPQSRLYPASTPTNPNPNPPSSGPLSFQIVSYDCNTGVLQYQFASSDNSPVSVTIPGIFAGTMNPNTTATYTFPSDAKTGRTVSGSGSQGSNQASVNFTTSCDLSGTNPNPNPPTSGPLSFQIVSYDCNSGLLQYKFNSSDNSVVNVTLPGIFAGTMSPNTVASYTFPSDGRVGRSVSGYASQSGNQISINFTNGCNLSGARVGTVDEHRTDQELMLSVRPNPNSGQFEVELLVAENQSYLVGVSDLLGHVVWQTEGMGTGHTELKAIDLQGRFRGSAIVYIQVGKQRVSKLILVKP